MHYFQRSLAYIGWGGQGKQVRDLLHVEDLADLVDRQLADFDRHNGRIYNVGGGVASSLSLLETTRLCQQITGHSVPITQVSDNRPADLKLYITDTSRVSAATGWEPRRTPEETLRAIYTWIREHEPQVRHLWVGEAV
jgi:CDP-paratose 2-epimerase